MSQHLKTWITTLCMCLLVLNVNAQERGRLVGRIVDEATGDPLFMACVVLQKTHQGAESDHEGYYWIPDIPPGTYEVQTSRIGYTNVEGQEVRIAAGLTTEMNISMVNDPIYAKEEVTVTATRGNDLVSEVPASVTVINAETIELQKPQNLAEVLQNVQGVNIKDYGGIGGIKSVSLRGSSASQVLVLVDGQRVNDTASGQVDFSRISVEGVEKIEVVRGGGSALYGANAIGGVINIITRKEKARNITRGSLNIMAGSFSSASVKTDLRNSGEHYAASLTCKALHTDGDFRYRHPDLDSLVEKANNDFTAYDVFTNFQYTLGEKPREHTIDVSYNYYTNDKGSPGSTTQPYATARTTTQSNRLNLNIQGKLNLFNNYRIQGFGSQSTNTYFNEEMTVAADDTHKTAATGLEMQFTSTLTANQTLIYGAGIRQNKSGGEGSTDLVNERAERFAFMQDEFFIHFDRIRLIRSIAFLPALRLDGYSDFGNHISKKLGTVLNLGLAWRTSIKANWSYNYKAPSFNDLYWPEDAFTIGNPDLKPEYGTDWDLGLRLRYPILNGIAFDINYFRMQLTDLIVWRQGGSGGKWAPENVSKAVIRGVEGSLSLKLVPKLLDLAVNYTYLDARNNDKNDRNYYQKYLVYRPKHTLNINLSGSWRGFTGNLSGQHVGYRYVSPANTIWLDPYQVADLTLGWQHDLQGWDLDVSLQVKNMFNKLYEFVHHQPIPGREFRLNVGIGCNFNQ
ncbi:MAG: TonB-dependent receptor [Candidatus Marinimicrobia bacterium]|nr:TonB-dependent receptor [Candidatus Neomarinimicrobiota bacterium]